ncbi:MAG: UvrD-helicase domain-containing protein [Bacteroidales bacterium]|nr:UvrD-helicase domain-containing protein [Bacteroidales bacterium]
MNDLFEHLNQHQIEAVKATEGRIRVTAGAGSGKTRVLAHRYAYLVNALGISPSNILCVTFTNKAANEMKKRIGGMVSAGNTNDFVCTLHGFCVKFLRKEIHRLGYPHNFIVLDEEDSKDLAKLAMKEFDLEANQITVKQFLASIARFKRTSPYIYGFMLPSSIFKTINETSRYFQLQLKSFALDFDDLIYFTIYILENYSDAKAYWQDKLNYIMVDEAQDFSERNWTLIELLSEHHKNLFIVGDPDQSIYEWRGARPELFLNFDSDKDFILEENYRSTPNILEVANSVIKNNKKRIEKRLITNISKGKNVIHYHGKDDADESDWIANQIVQFKKSGFAYSDCAILYRASYLSRSVEQALLKKKISYTVWGGIRFFERKEIKDALGYLKLIAYYDDLAFRRIINVPSRKFGRVSMEKVQKIAEAQKISLYDALKIFNKESGNEQIKAFITLVDDMVARKNSVSISDLLNYVLNESGYMNMIRTDSDEERLENLEELLSSIKNYEHANQDDEISIDTYLQDIALYTNADYKNDESTVKLMTIHQSKGLEFPIVFICGLTEGVFPSHRSIRERKGSALEEERRLFYVASTRAEKHLFLTESEGYNASSGTDKYPSRFISEIADNLVEVEGNLRPELLEGTKYLVKSIDSEIDPEPITPLNVGEHVSHMVFGEGVVVEVNLEEDTCKVHFKDGDRHIRPSFLTPLV